MGKAERQARRAARKAAKAERKSQLNRLIEAIKNSKIDFKPDGDHKIPFVDVFNEFWPILDPALKYAIAMKKTNEKTDKALQDVWDVGNAIANGGGSDQESAFMKKFDTIWDVLGGILHVVEELPFFNDKVKGVIEDIIDIGDWISDGGAEE